MTPPTDIKSRSLRGLKWSAVGRIGVQLVNWLITIQVVRILTPEDYGLMAMAVVFTTLVSNIREFGFSATLIQLETLSLEQMRKVFFVIICIHLGIFILLFVSAPAAAWFYDEPKITWVLRALSFEILISIFIVVPQALLIRDLNLKAKSIVDLVSGLAAGFITLYFAFNGYGVWALVAGVIGGALARLVATNVAMPIRFLPLMSLEGLAPLVRFGGTITLQRILTSVYWSADSLIIGRWLGPAPLGVYAVAMQLASLPMVRVNAIVDQASFPAYSRIQSEPELVQNYAQKALKLLALFAFPVFWGIAAVADPAVRVILGDKWLEAILPMQILAVILPFRMLYSHMTVIMNGLGSPEKVLRCVVLATTVIPLGFLIGIRWGITGVCVSWLVTFPAVLLYAAAMLKSSAQIGYLSQAKIVAVPLVSAALMLAVTASIQIFITQAWPPIFALVATIAAGVVAYTSVVVLLDRSAPRLVKSVIVG